MTIKEFALLAGVSPAAVSRYFNGGSLSEEKRERIRAAIDRTGYQPDAAAQTLRTKTTRLVGLIVPKLDSESVSRLAAGATERLLQNGYLCQFAVSQNDPERELSYLSLFQQRQMAGVILMATANTDRHRAALQSLGLPVVVTGQRFEGVSCVYHDDRNAAQALTERILRRGRRELAFLGVSEQDVAVGVERREGVKAAMAAFGLSPEQLTVELSGFDLESGRAAAERLLARKPQLDAVVCATDRIAFGAMEALRAAGRRIPQDVSVVGMGDSWASEHIVPHLTTAHFYYKTSGETAAELLLTMMRSRETQPPIRQILVGFSVCDRDSV